MKAGPVLFLRTISVFLLLGLTGCHWQEKAMFFGCFSQGVPGLMLHSNKSYEIVTLHAKDGTKIGAVFGKALVADGSKTRADWKSCPTVMYFYGNGACSAFSIEVVEQLRRQGVNVINPDYEGYGLSGGDPNEKGCYEAADAVYDYLISRPDIDHGRIISMGWSLGGAVAIDLASRRPVHSLVCVGAFTSMYDMVHGMLPLLPAKMILKYDFDNMTKIKRISCPILLIHARQDPVVPYFMMDKLASAAGKKAETFTVDRGTHSILYDPERTEMWATLRRFFWE